MKYNYSEQKFKKMRQNVILRYLLWILAGTFISALANEYQIRPILISLALFCMFFGFIGYVWLQRTNKFISKMKNDQLWLTESSIVMQGEMGTNEMPFSTIEKFKCIKFQGVKSIMVCLINGEQIVYGGYSHQEQLLNELKSAMPSKFT